MISGKNGISLDSAQCIPYITPKVIREDRRTPLRFKSRSFENRLE